MSAPLSQGGLPNFRRCHHLSRVPFAGCGTSRPVPEDMSTTHGSAGRTRDAREERRLRDPFVLVSNVHVSMGPG